MPVERRPRRWLGRRKGERAGVELYLTAPDIKAHNSHIRADSNGGTKTIMEAKYETHFQQPGRAIVMEGKVLSHTQLSLPKGSSVKSMYIRSRNTVLGSSEVNHEQSASG